MHVLYKTARFARFPAFSPVNKFPQKTTKNLKNRRKNMKNTQKLNEKLTKDPIKLTKWQNSAKKRPKH